MKHFNLILFIACIILLASCYTVHQQAAPTKPDFRAYKVVKVKHYKGQAVAKLSGRTYWYAVSDSVKKRDVITITWVKK